MSKLVTICAVVMLLAFAFATYYLPTANASCMAYRHCESGEVIYNADCLEPGDCITITAAEASDLQDTSFGSKLVWDIVPVWAPLCIDTICGVDLPNYFFMMVQQCEHDDCDE